MLALEVLIRAGFRILLKKDDTIMATIDDLEADEATLKDNTAKLINLAGSLLAQVTALKTAPGVPADVQSKIDDLHAKFHDDLASITSAISADGAPLNPVDQNKQLPPPFISGVSPASGPAGTVVSLTGRDFTGIEGVTVGGVAASTFSSPNDTSASVTVPDGLPPGDTQIIVTNAQGQSNAGAFTVMASAPVATPPSAPAATSQPAPAPAPAP